MTQLVEAPVRDQLDDDQAQALLSNIGYLLVHGAPFDRGPAYLLVALRPRPTRTHFDAERLELWLANDGRHEPIELQWPLSRGELDYAWGVIRLVDRVPVANEFVSFGGSLAISRDAELHAALFRSDAPILALDGRTGRPDPLAVPIAAFLARLRGAAGYDSPVCALARSLSPVALYAAFIHTSLDSQRRPRSAGPSSPTMTSLLRTELRRLEREDPVAAEAGRSLGELLAQH